MCFLVSRGVVTGGFEIIKDTIVNFRQNALPKDSKFDGLQKKKVLLYAVLPRKKKKLELKQKIMH